MSVTHAATAAGVRTPVAADAAPPCMLRHVCLPAVLLKACTCLPLSPIIWRHLLLPTREAGIRQQHYRVCKSDSESRGPCGPALHPRQLYTRFRALRAAMACCLRPGGCSAASCAVPNCNSAHLRAGASRAAIQTYGCLGSVCSGGRMLLKSGWQSVSVLAPMACNRQRFAAAANRPRWAIQMRLLLSCLSAD